MARNPGADNDGVRPAIRQRERVRGVRIRPRAGDETRTCFVGGAITTGMYIGPLDVSIDPDDTSPGWKYLVGLRGRLRTGTCTVEWLHNGSLIATQNVTTTTADGVVVIDPPVELADGSELQPTITLDSGASDLTVSVVIVMSPS